MEYMVAIKKDTIKTRSNPLFMFMSILVFLALGAIFGAQPVFAWSNTGGGDHGGADWTVPNGTTISGVHTGIGTFTVSGTAYVGRKVYGYLGYLQIYASIIDISGVLDAVSAGHLGGNGGRGGIGGNGYDYPWGGNPGSGTYGGAGGTGYQSYGRYGNPERNEPQRQPTNGGNAGNGGYRCRGGQCDSTTNETIYMGSGGGGGGGGQGSVGTNCWWYGGAGGGGGAGGRGGGYVKLIASQSINMSAGRIKTNGDWSGGNGLDGAGQTSCCITCVPAYLLNPGLGGSNTDWQSSLGGAGGVRTYYGLTGAIGGNGGTGAGGGVLLKAPTVNLSGGVVDARGGGNYSFNGGTLKVFYGDSGSYSPGSYYTGRTYVATYDATPPTLSVSPAGGNFTSAPVNYTATWGDSGSGLSTCYISIDGASWYSWGCSGSSANYSSSFASYGSHTVVLYGADNNGNYAYSSTYAFNIYQAPTADIQANGSNGPITIIYNTSATISWGSSNATSCSVTPSGWTGTAGSQSTGALSSSQTYTLNCSGLGGTASDSVTVNISPQCSDGIDNDGDGWIDANDPGCGGSGNYPCTSAGNESCTPNNPNRPQCSDGIDNDGDGLVDGYDPECTGPTDNSEAPPPPPDFSLLKSFDISISVVGNKSTESGVTTIMVSPANSFSGVVGLSSNISQIINGATATFTDSNLSQNEYSAGTTLKVTVPSSAIGTHTITITGVSGGITKSVDITLNVSVVDPNYKNF